MLKFQRAIDKKNENKIIQLLLLICCLPALTGCIREEEYANDPVGNFEQLWKIIDEQYCFLEAKGIDWDAVHENTENWWYRPCPTMICLTF